MLPRRICLLSFFIPCVAAQAGIVTVRDAVGGENGYFVTGTSGTIRATFSAGSWTNYSVGVDDFEMSSGSGYTPVKAFCIEPTQYLSFGTNPNDTAGKTYGLTDMASDGVLSADVKSKLGRLWSNAYGQASSSKVGAAAFQAVIWELLLDSSANLSLGNFRLNGDDSFTSQVKTTAQQWLDNLSSNAWSNSANLFVLRSSASQDLLTNVPEPGTIGLLTVAALFAFHKRRSFR